MIYKASTDNLVKAITAGCFILFVVIGFYTFYKETLAFTEYKNIIPAICINLPFVLIVGICWAFAPNYYKVTDNELIIKKNIGAITIKKNTIKEVKIVDKEEISGAIRTFGVGGLFGFYGRFKIPKIGNTTFFITQRKNLLLIVDNTDKKWIISPNNIDLIKSLNTYNTSQTGS